jgi:YegS/Rv2252/BmrU family lipid kinase
MKKVCLLYNLASGQKREQRTQQIAHIAELFRGHGMEVDARATTHAGSAVQQTQDAASAGFDTVLACGGDGTFNEVLNGVMLVQSPDRQPAIGVVPLGSGNLLATDLRLPSDPVAAARTLLDYQPREIYPGVLTSQHHGRTEQRYFVVAAGVGSDAQLMYRTAVESKERFGRNAYFLEMARMAAQGQFPMFHVEWKDEQGQIHEEKITLAMAIRARHFPGLLHFVNLGSSLGSNHYSLLLFRTGNVFHFANYFASVATGLNWKVPKIDVVTSRWFRCTALDESALDAPKIHAQADGELLGRVPAEVSIAEKSFQLLMRPDS